MPDTPDRPALVVVAGGDAHPVATMGVAGCPVPVVAPWPPSAGGVDAEAAIVLRDGVLGEVVTAGPRVRAVIAHVGQVFASGRTAQDVVRELLVRAPRDLDAELTATNTRATAIVAGDDAEAEAAIAAWVDHCYDVVNDPDWASDLDIVTQPLCAPFSLADGDEPLATVLAAMAAAGVEPRRIVDERGTIAGELQRDGVPAVDVAVGDDPAAFARVLAGLSR